MQVELDSVDLQILELLQADARITMRALGAAVGLSGPAVTERVRRLEDRGIIRGYHAEVDPGLLGLSVVAFIALGAPYEEHVPGRFEAQIHEIQEVVECYRISGEDRYLVKVFAADIPALQEVLDRLRGFSRVRSAVVLNALKRQSTLRPPRSTRRQPVFHHGAD